MDAAVLGPVAGTRMGRGATGKLQVEDPGYAAQQDSNGLQQTWALQTLLTDVEMAPVLVQCGLPFHGPRCCPGLDFQHWPEP